MKRTDNILIYPFDKYSLPYLRHKHLIDGHHICQIVSPQGWGLSGKDASCESKGNSGLLNMTVSSDFNKALASCDTAWFVESERQLDFQKHIYPKIVTAIKQGKNIIIGKTVPDHIEKEIRSLCNKHSVSYGYDYKESRTILNFLESEHNFGERLIGINTPVVFVLGTGEKMQKFEIQLSLREGFINAGYKVSQVGSRDFCELMQFHSIPGELYKKNMTEYEKIIFFNRYVKTIEREENPDIFIIGIPGGVMPYNKQFTNRFGFMAYIISHAIEPDIAVLSINYQNWSSDYLKNLEISIEHKLGYSINCFNLSNTQLNWTDSMERGYLVYDFLEYETVEQKKMEFPSYHKPVYNILNSKDKADMFDFIVKKLSEYGEVQVL